MSEKQISVAQVSIKMNTYVPLFILLGLSAYCSAVKDYCFFCAKAANPYIDYCYSHHRDSVVTGTDTFVDAMCGLYNMRDPIPQALVQQSPSQQVANMYTDNAFMTYPENRIQAPLQPQSVINPALLQPQQAPKLKRAQSSKNV